MTNVIYPLRFRNRGPAIRAVHPVDELPSASYAEQS